MRVSPSAQLRPASLVKSVVICAKPALQAIPPAISPYADNAMSTAPQLRMSQPSIISIVTDDLGCDGCFDTMDRSATLLQAGGGIASSTHPIAVKAEPRERGRI